MSSPTHPTQDVSLSLFLTHTHIYIYIYIYMYIFLSLSAHCGCPGCSGDPQMYFTEMCCGDEAGSYLRRIDSCSTQLKAQGPSRTCNESKAAEEEVLYLGAFFASAGRQNYSTMSKDDYAGTETSTFSIFNSSSDQLI